jgi:hypothetical protein
MSSPWRRQWRCWGACESLAAGSSARAPAGTYGTRLALQIFRRLDLTVPDREQMKAFIAHLSVPVERLGDSYIGYSRVPMLMRSDAPLPP